MGINAIKHLEDHKLEVWLSAGGTKIIDLGDFIKSSDHPLINKYADVELFKQVYLDEIGIPSWGENEFDISPQSILNGDYDVK
jgi:hypothetical protein